MSKKYLTKNEFRNYKNPNYLSKSGKPHKAYISVRHKDNYRFNVITHSSSFFGEKTNELEENPDKNFNRPAYKIKSKFSIPVWDKKNNFSEEKLSGWRLSKNDKKKIKKINKRYLKNKNQP